MALMADINCAPKIAADLPSQILYDPNPSANIPSGVFVRIPIDLDDANWRHDGIGATGRIQQDTGNEALVVTETGMYSGHSAVRVNPLSTIDAPGDNPYMVELEIRRNGTPWRRMTMAAADGWDLNAGHPGPPFNAGIIESVHFTGFLTAGDSLDMWLRATAFNGGSFTRLGQPQYGSLELTKLGEMKATDDVGEIGCGVKPVAYSGCVQSWATVRTITDGPPTPSGVFVRSQTFQWTDYVDEGGDGAGNPFMAWGPVAGTFSNNWGPLANQVTVNVVRQSQEVRHFQAPNPYADPFGLCNFGLGRNPNTLGGLLSSERRHQCGHPRVANEGLSGFVWCVGGTYYLPAPAGPINNIFMAHDQYAASLQHGPRAMGSVISIEVAP